MKRKAYTMQNTTTARIFDACKRARQHYADKKDAHSQVIQECERIVNRYKDQHDTLRQFIETKWLRFEGTKNHYYIQLA